DVLAHDDLPAAGAIVVAHDPDTVGCWHLDFYSIIREVRSHPDNAAASSVREETRNAVCRLVKCRRILRTAWLRSRLAKATSFGVAFPASLWNGCAERCWNNGMPANNRIVAIEEHFWIPELRDRYSGARGISGHTPARQLDDLGEIRLREMDAAGIDVPVISHMQPGTQIFDPDTAVALARKANDALYAAPRAHPARFAGFAELPTVDPKAAADELERTVTRHDFKGALINGLTAGAFLDQRRFWCIFERAQALDVPIYFHPCIPPAPATEAYYSD